ncbi:MAG: PTS sugar transporter subunit IIA [Pseudomonadota bacterium]
MIGIVLVTHGALATSFKDAVEHVVGEQERFATICIEADDDMEERRRDIIEAIAAVDRGNGVVVVTDMFGGTPSNLAISLMEPGRIEIVAGANLPMLIKLARVRNSQDINQSIVEATEAGRKYINVASQLLTARG